MPLFWRFFGHRLGAYAVTMMVLANLAMLLVWTELIFRSLPDQKPLPLSAVLFILAIPLIIFVVTMTGFCVAVACEYSVFVRGQRLHLELESDRAARDADIARGVLERLAERAKHAQEDHDDLHR